MRLGRLYGQVILKRRYLNLGLDMCGLHKMLGIVDLLCLFSERRLLLSGLVIENQWVSKIRNYKHFSSLLDVEKYLFLDLSFKFRNALAKFRCLSHSLMIEKGRHMGLDRPSEIVLYVFKGTHMRSKTNTFS